ncbi:uncharacterized protein [Clytia hemisphaerica]|uniref:Cnidarian restricted protein n=1 Tax=Clytia hemisphaerica TaxID=252671 RepID=A0A7M5WUK6_9CNID|eukprot:TCONS_00011577-protein
MKVYFVAVCIFLACSHIQCKKPIKLKFIEELLGDSVPLTKCVDHPAYEEEPEMFKECPKGQSCFFVQRDITLTIFGTFCEWSLSSPNEGSGDKRPDNFVEEESGESESESEENEVEGEGNPV